MVSVEHKPTQVVAELLVGFGTTVTTAVSVHTTLAIIQIVKTGRIIRKSVNATFMLDFCGFAHRRRHQYQKQDQKS